MADQDRTTGKTQAEARQTSGSGITGTAEGGASPSREPTDGEQPSALGGGVATKTKVNPEDEKRPSKSD